MRHLGESEKKKIYILRFFNMALLANVSFWRRPQAQVCDPKTSVIFREGQGQLKATFFPRVGNNINHYRINGILQKREGYEGDPFWPHSVALPGRACSQGQELWALTQLDAGLTS